MGFEKDELALAPRPEVIATPAAQHGALDYAELERLGLKPDEVLDFSVNSNPYGPSPAVYQSLEQIPLDRYPDREALTLRRALADQIGVSSAHILVGNGTAELLWLVAVAFLRPGDRSLVVGPTFGEYGRVTSLMGAKVNAWTARPDRDFAVEPREISCCLQKLMPRLVFVCNPNNPTGSALPPEIISSWAKDHPRILFVVDEAYLAFAPGLGSVLLAGADNILVLRSMTKDYALAGLRLGYAVGHAATITALGRVRPAWNVNALAQAAGVAALRDEAHLRTCLEALGPAKKELVAALRNLGLAPLPSVVHFFLVPVGDGCGFRQELLREGILVRDCTSFGLPAYVRIATRCPEENAHLVKAISTLTSRDADAGIWKLNHLSENPGNTQG